MRVTNLLLIVTLAGSISLAQQVSKQLVDASPSDSPLKSLGTCTIQQQVSEGQVSSQYSYDWQLQNVSSRQIVGMNGQVSVVYPNGLTDQAESDYDWFFHPKVLEEAGTVTMSDGSLGKTTMPVTEIKAQTSQPSCKAQVLWVQFADGSTFGEDRYGQRVLDARMAIWNGLQRLKTAYTERGMTGFEAELAQRDKSPDADAYISHLRDAAARKGVYFAYQSLMMHIDAGIDHGIDRLIQSKLNK